MALNLKTFATRTISAIVFVILLIGSVLWNYYSFTIFFFIISLIGLFEFYKIAEKLGAKPYRTLGYICGICCYLIFINFDFLFQYTLTISNIFYLSIPFPFLILATSLFSKQEHPIHNSLFTIGGIIYAVLPFALLNHLVLIKVPEKEELEFYPRIVLGVILLIWSNDTFAYLGGSLFGKNKMIEHVSPGKTWEGTVFGILVTFGISFLIKEFIYFVPGLFWMSLGLAVPILATIGDLVESLLKRQAGIKDSGTIMPGHGGVLDRFDSLIFVSPFVYVIFKLL